MSASRSSRIVALLIPTAIGTVLLLTSTTSLHETAWKYDVKRMLELWLLPVIFAGTLATPALRAAFLEQARRVPRWLGTVLLTVFAIGIVSSAYNASSTMSLAYSLAEVGLMTSLILAVLVVAACRSLAGAAFDSVAIIFLAVIGTAVGLQELIGVLAAWSSGLEFHPRIALMHFSWPRFYNQMQSWSIPVIAALPLLFGSRASAKVLCIAALALNWYVVIATGGRGTMLAVTVAIATVALLFSGGRRDFIVRHVSGLLAGILIYASIAWGHGLLPESADTASSFVSEDERVETLPKQREDSGDFMEPLTGKRFATSSGRVEMWRDALREFSERPLLGNGPMNYACKGPVYRSGHPHSFPLQLLHEWGLPATLLLVIASMYLAWRLISNLAALDRMPGANARLSIALTAGLLAAAIHSCLSGVFVMPASQLTGVLVAGWLLGVVRSAGAAADENVPGPPVASAPGHHSKACPQKSSGLSHGLILPVALTISTLLLVFGMREFAVAPARLEQTAMLDRLIPRFWQNGKVCRLYQQEK